MNSNNKIKIIFMGTPKFAVPALKKLADDKRFEILAVIAATDKRIGRKQILTPPPVKIFARENKILVFQPKRIENFKLQISNLKPDLIIVCAFGQIIPKSILDIPKYDCLNIHPSLLPKYRGPSPIQTAILNGEKQTGVTIMLVDEKMDRGPILKNCELQITNCDFTYEKLSEKLSELGAQLLIETIPEWINGKIKAKPQEESLAAYTKIIQKEDGKINWKKSAQEIENQIRAFYPWPGTFTFWQKLKLKIIQAAASLEKHNLTPGKVFLDKNNQISVACGKGYLILKKIQLEGKKENKIEDFIKGHLSFLGSILN
ncbi:MAG: methionyl-tRNA formyltransferase [Parcubacteria group bacterium Athens1014_10]|nr:MAG: methionyl-tRNA formyltransferase [Parcubacteria group bacterium Athens1014_10]TSD06040.1 MAG: methionyl-tRNA formyltransferase [Parcubacteria group bacterium Athens0714_12]